MTKRNNNGQPNGTNLGFETTLWAAADKLRGHMDAAEYKHVVLGLIFLKYISDAFEERYQQLQFEFSDPYHENFIREEPMRYVALEDRDEYTAANVFWVPTEARWSTLQAFARSPEIGQKVDDAMHAVEQENPKLRGVLSKDYARPTLDKRMLGELIDLIGTIGLGDADSRSKDVLGRVYEYFLGQFALAEGRKGGQFYTPQAVVKLLVAMLEPYPGRVYDPCCGSGGMFVQSEKFVSAHGGERFAISIFGQESNATTWRLAKMNLALRGIEANLGPENADSFYNDLHPDLKADYVLANPPFNMADWGASALAEDARWRFGTPPAGNANYAWLSHIVHHLAPRGRAGVVLANGSMSSNSGGEGEIRKRMIEGRMVDCMVALPPQLFYSTQIPACLWFLDRGKANGPRPDEVLFIDARNMGYMANRTHRDIGEDDIARIAALYHDWRQGPAAGSYADEAGFCKSATLDEVAGHEFVLTPGRYVGLAEAETDDEPFGEKLARLTEALETQFAESERLQASIRANLASLGE